MYVSREKRPALLGRDKLVRQILSRTVRIFFHFLPISYLIDIRTAKFLKKMLLEMAIVCVNCSLTLLYVV